jgi:Protein of unknown function (DUF2628)
MSVYTVHQPPSRAGNPASDAEGYVFVRDGFSFWAFVFGPLWMLRHRMWLALLGYVLASGGLEMLARVAGASQFGIGLVGFLISFLVGLEAGTLRRFTLGRRGYRNVGVVSGHDLEDAEQRFFDSWLKQPSDRAPSPPAPIAPAPPTPPAPSAAGSAAMPRGPDVIGLFPEPGGSR